MNREEALEEIKLAKREGRKAHLMYAKLAYVDLSGVDLIGADLREADLHGANLAGADLYCAHFSDANLVGADLRRANLRSSHLSYANLRHANLIGADFRLADMICTVLKEAYLGERQVLQIGPIGSRRDYLVAKLFEGGDTEVMAGCFNGTLSEFKEAVMRTHESGSKYREQYLSAIAFILENFNIKPVEEVTKDEQPF